VIQRLPLRVRLSATFAAVMAILLGATCLFVYTRLASALDDTIDAGLRSRAQDLAAVTQQAPSQLRHANRAGLIEPDESFAQIITREGSIVDATPQLATQQLLTRAQREHAIEHPPLFVDVGAIGSSDNASRLLAVPVGTGAGNLIVVVGTSLETRDEALSTLRAQLLIGGPIALLLASLAGYWLAAAALRPVARMQRRAARISGEHIDQRLPLPAAHDEIRELGETLNTMLDRIEATLRRERRFIADASHELRTPLSLLRAELELAQWPGRTREELEDALRSASDESDRLSQLAEDLLVLARADDGALPVKIEPLDTHTLLVDTAMRFQARARSTDRIIVVSDDNPRLDGDRLRLEQAIGNLIDNALRHGDGVIRLTAGGDATATTLVVSDEGAGFAPAFLQHAFERFARADEARSGGGTGLGLAIVDVIARAHGGTAQAANSAPGAEVSLTIPLRHQHGVVPDVLDARADRIAVRS
jgi:two-component system, OmpR family, sensor kinase